LIGRFGVRALVLAAVLLTCACGSSNTGAPTQPSPPQPAPAPPPVPAAPVVVYSTLGPFDGRDNAFNYYPSAENYPRVADDFVAAASAEVRSITWDGVYCDPRFQVPLAVPPPVARSFRVVLSADVGGNFPASTLYERSFDAAEVRQERQFDVLEESFRGCPPRTPAPVSFYRFSVQLPTAISMTAGRKYWLEVSADTATSGIGWCWRASTSPGRSWIGYFGATWPWEMAFSLASQ
jgi:hypothetical protein